MSYNLTIVPAECYPCSLLQKYQQSDQEEHEQLFGLIQAMLTYDPAERIGLDQVLR